jgi:hypothetical protein
MKCPKCETDLKISAKIAEHDTLLADITLRCPKCEYSAWTFVAQEEFITDE